MLFRSSSFVCLSGLSGGEKAQKLGTPKIRDSWPFPNVDPTHPLNQGEEERGFKFVTESCTTILTASKEISYLVSWISLWGRSRVTITEGIFSLETSLESLTSGDKNLRGPAAILSISRDTCSASIAKLFRACFYVKWDIAQLSRDTLQNGVSHRCACLKLSTKEGYRTILGERWPPLKRIARYGVPQR